MEMEDGIWKIEEEDGERGEVQERQQTKTDIQEGKLAKASRAEEGQAQD